VGSHLKIKERKDLIQVYILERVLWQGCDRWIGGKFGHSGQERRYSLAYM
jgi:hypothetical protein